MARPQKIKLDYFPLECGFFQDERIIALRREHGALGIVTYIFLLTKVYDNGYYLKIRNLESFSQTVAENIASNREPTAKVAAHVVKAIRYMAEIDLISKQLLKVNCITGVKIQEQYAKSKERYGGQALIKEFSLINGEHSSPIVLEDKTAINVTETPVYLTETPVYLTEMPQSKIKESKVNNTHSAGAREETTDFEKSFNAFCNRWDIEIDTCSPYMADLDFDGLSKAFEESPNYLQNKDVAPWAHTLTGILKNAKSICAGKYKDRVKGKSAFKRQNEQDTHDILQNLFNHYKAEEEKNGNE